MSVWVCIGTRTMVEVEKRPPSTGDRSSLWVYVGGRGGRGHRDLGRSSLAGPALLARAMFSGLKADSSS